MNSWSLAIDNNKLINLVLQGKKTATSYLYSDDDIPKIGEESIIRYDNGKDACIVKTVDFKILKFSEMTEEYAKLEGEEDLTLEYWKKVHYEFFKSIKQDFTEDDKIIFEIFEVEKDFINEYKVEVIDNIDDNRFNELEELIKEFAISVFGGKKEDLNKDIGERIQFARDSITKKRDGIETRYYILLNNNKVIAFQTAQVRNNNGIIEGWRNFAYISKEYAGRKGFVTNTYGEESKGFLSEILYENITKWFQENNVQIERTATGKNMRKHLLVYIVMKGYIPERVDDKRVYLVKDYSKPKSKEELKKIYKNFIKE